MERETIICEVCSLPFYPDDLSSVAEHMHDGIDIKEEYNSKRVISHASEIFPNASKQFCCGVHSYLNGIEISDINDESSDFKNGYWQAMDNDLKDKVKLKRD